MSERSSNQRVTSRHARAFVDDLCTIQVISPQLREVIEKRIDTLQDRIDACETLLDVGHAPPADEIARLRAALEHLSLYVAANGDDWVQRTARDYLDGKIPMAADAAPYVMKPSEAAVFEKVRKKYIVKPDESGQEPSAAAKSCLFCGSTEHVEVCDSPGAIVTRTTGCPVHDGQGGVPCYGLGPNLSA